MIHAEICRNALREVYRDDLAKTIGTNKSGDPMRGCVKYNYDDAVIVAKAFILAYYKKPMFALDIEHLTIYLLEGLQMSMGPDIHWSPTKNKWLSYFNPYDWIESECNL